MCVGGKLIQILNYKTMKKYIIYDTTDNPVGVPFNTWKDAETYKIVYGRPDWNIRLVHIHIDRKSTERQRKAVSFVEEWCNISFEGNIYDFYEVSDFLADYLDTAKEIAQSASKSYWLMING